MIETGCDCYKEIYLVVKDHVDKSVIDGESIKVELHKEWHSDHRYISINYDTIRDKVHVSQFAHISAFFLSSTISRDCVRYIIEDIIRGWRGVDESNK